ncbi:major royal jelly protein 1-like isoform X1 [Diorhabda carinulata]|uniref:major royal jelly protein 1-like isoform X1 n=2 Tax=Diorhabda carinulata TaxID=1163345 RepID=UPI0025A21145|nr:major royal jelly protein 1-like isoform X1 [Diorhabda carinulata]
MKSSIFRRMDNTFILSLYLVILLQFSQFSCLEVLHQWNLLSYDFPPNFNLNDFRPENNVFTGVEVTDDRIFIAVPRLRPGVASTINTIPKYTPKGSSPVLQAYPDWSFHGAASNNYNCSGLISVYRMRVDSCNRLWVLDAGTVDTLEDFRSVCPPKLLIFDLRTDQVIRTIIFPKKVTRLTSVLTNLIIDEGIRGFCDSAFVYISDSVAPGLIVYDSSSDRTWRFSDPSMFPNPDYANINIGGDQFALMDGIIGLAHSPHIATLFYQPLATDRIFSIPTSELIKGPPGEFDQLPISVAGRKSSQGLPLAIDQSDNTLFFSPMTETSIASWNTVNNHQEVLVTDPLSLQFVADLRWKQDGYLYILSSRFHKFFKKNVSDMEINLRLLRLSVGAANPYFHRINDNLNFQ